MLVYTSAARLSLRQVKPLRYSEAPSGNLSELTGYREDDSFCDVCSPIADPFEVSPHPQQVVRPLNVVGILHLGKHRLYQFIVMSI